MKGRAGHASFVRDGKLYIHGGYDTGHGVLADLIEIDLSNGEEASFSFKMYSLTDSRRLQKSTILALCRTSRWCRM